MSERQTVFCDGPGCSSTGSANAGQARDAWIRATIKLRGFDNTFEEGDFCSEKCVQEWLVKDALPTARSGAR